MANKNGLFGQFSSGNEPEERQNHSGVEKVEMRTVYASPEFFAAKREENGNRGAPVYASPEVMNGSRQPIMQGAYPYFAPPGRTVRQTFHCMHCGYRKPADADYCSICGKVTEQPDAEATLRICRNCWNDAPVEATFCPYCGVKLRG